MRKKTEEEIEVEEKRKVAEEAIGNAPKIPVLAGLPEYLKDPANYEKIQKQLIDTLASGHSHGDMLEWSSCASCQKRMQGRAELMSKLGFTCPQQYMAWEKIHRMIKERVKLR